MDKYDPSKFDPFIKLDRLDSRLDRLDSTLSKVDSTIGGVDASLARAAAASGAYDPTIWTGIRLAEHQYLLDQKAQIPPMGIAPATRNALEWVPALNVVAPQVAQWAQNLTGIAEQVGSIFSKVEQFVDIVGGRMATMATEAGKLYDAIGASEAVTGLDRMIGVLPKIQDFNGFWDAIVPALDDLRQMMEDASDGDTALEEAEFGFADHLWNVFYLRGFAHIDERVRSAVVTNKLVARTSSDQFVDELRCAVEISQMMRKRWRVIERAVEAHASRKYELSVPVFLAQIEGTVGDIMFLKDLVRKEGNKYYLVDECGNFKVNKKGKRLQAVTLAPALKNARLEQQGDLTSASAFMADVMVQRRNDVLHGRDVYYGRAKFSVQALLILTVLAQGLAELEIEGQQGLDAADL